MIRHLTLIFVVNNNLSIFTPRNIENNTQNRLQFVTYCSIQFRNCTEAEKNIQINKLYFKHPHVSITKTITILDGSNVTSFFSQFPVEERKTKLNYR